MFEDIQLFYKMDFHLQQSAVAIVLDTLLEHVSMIATTWVSQI